MNCDELELVKRRNCDLKLPLFGVNILNEKHLFYFYINSKDNFYVLR